MKKTIIAVFYQILLVCFSLILPHCYVQAGVISSNDGGKPNDAHQQKPTNEKTYQTYTKTNPANQKQYVGRTSGNGSPTENILKRDAGHHRSKEGYGPAQLDKSSTNKDAVRGREQHLIERNRANGVAADQINGIHPKNKNKKKYDLAARKAFGKH